MQLKEEIMFSIIKTREKFRLFIFMFFLLIPSMLFAAGKKPYTPQRAGFMLQANNTIIPYRVFAVFLLPGDDLVLEAVFEKTGTNYTAESSQGKVRAGERANTWTWQAPNEPGLAEIRVFHAAKQDTIKVNCFVMVPAGRLENGYLDGFRIGSYPASKKTGYEPVQGFIKVTEKNRERYLSPHFQLKEFESKQGGSFPRYVVLREKLLLKLEMILEELERQGYHGKKITIMSGYRTPYYNASIGNVKYSRIVWGDEADIFIDNYNDSLMDDINGDGRNDVKDARIVYRLIDALGEKTWYQPFIGGLGLYKRNSRRTAFVHVDVRGYRARWGK